MKNRFLRFTLVFFLSGLVSVMMAFTSTDGDGLSVVKTKKMTSSEYLSRVRNNQITGQVSMEDVLNARKDSKAMRSLKSSNATYNWVSMGPNNFGGPTRSIIFDNRDASGNTLYAGSLSGGLWKSTNYGATWNMVELDEVLNISTICQASDGTIYVGTGVSLEPTADKIAEGSTIGKGIYRATSGDDFQLMEGTAPSGNDILGDWAFVQKVAVDASGNIYAATNTGLKYYNGSTWAYAQADGANLIGKSCDVVSYDGIIIAAVACNTYISNSNYYGFTIASNDEDDGLPIGTFGNMKYAISESNSNYIYASYVTTDGSLYNVYLSTDKGLTWRVVYPGGSSVSDIFEGDGLRNNSIATNPNDEKMVFLGAHNLHKGYEAQPTGYYSWSEETSGASDPFPSYGQSKYLHYGINTIVFNPYLNGHILFGTDGGLGITKNNLNSLELLNRNYATSQYFTINADKYGTVVAGAQFNGVHSVIDNGSMQASELLRGDFGGPSPKTGGYNHISFINPEFYVCSSEDGAFWRSEDMGVNKNNDILSGVTPRGEFITPFLMWESTSNTFSPDSVDFAARKDYEAGETIWPASNSYDYPFKMITEQKLDSGDVIRVQDLVSTKCFIAVEGDSTATGGFNGGLYMTTGMLDFTETPEWWQIGAVEGIPTAMAYSADANYVWVGTLEGKLYRFSNIARATNKESADIFEPACIIASTIIDLETTQAITSLSVDPKNNENVLFTLGNYGNDHYAYVSNDGMSDHPSFTSAQGNLPKMPVYSSIFEMNAQGKVFIGTENGLYITDNIFASSVNWTYEDDGFGNIPIFSIKQQNVNWGYATFYINPNYSEYYPRSNNYGAIYLGTFGAGIYVTKDYVGFEEPIPTETEDNQLNVYPNPAQQFTNLVYESHTQGQVQIEIYDLRGRLVSTNQFNVHKGSVSLNVDLYHLQSGTYIVRLFDGVSLLQTKLLISK